MYARVWVCMFVHVSVHVFTCMSLCVYAYLLYTCVYACVCMFVHMSVRVHMYVCACVCVSVHICTCSCVVLKESVHQDHSTI